jgi:hypothetical protein
MNIFFYSVLHVWPRAKKSNILVNCLTRENFCLKEAVAQCIKLSYISSIKKGIKKENLQTLVKLQNNYISRHA